MSGIKIDVELDKSKAEQGIKNLNNSLQGVGKTAANTGESLDKALRTRSLKDLADSAKKSSTAFKEFGDTGSKSLNKVSVAAGQASAKVDDTTSSVKQLATALAVIGSATVGITYLDEFTRLSNKINLVTEDAIESLNIQKQLLDLANKNRAGIEGTTETYAQFARALSSSGIATERLLKVTDTVAKSIAISGSSAETAKAGLTQLGQGLAAGALRGEEFNSVLENLPVVAQLLTKELGGNVGELRKLAEAGELTTTAVFAAIEAGANDIGQSFAKASATAGQGFTQLNNVLLTLAGQVNNTFKVTQSIFNGLSASATKLESIGTNMISYLSQGASEISNYLELSKTNSAVASLNILRNTFKTLSEKDISSAYTGIGEIETAISKLPSKIGIVSKAFKDIFTAIRGNAVSNSQDGIARILGDLPNIVSIVSPFVSAIKNIRISLSDAYGVLVTFIYAVTGLGHTFKLLIPNIQGPVVTLVEGLSASFTEFRYLTKGIVDETLYAYARSITGIAEGLSYFILANSRTERAIADLARSKSLKELMTNLNNVGNVLRSSRAKSVAGDLELLRTKFQSIGVEVENVLIFLGLMDQRLVSITGIRPKLLLQFFKTTGDAIEILYKQILIPRLTPLIGSIKGNIIPLIEAYKKGITNALEDLDARSVGESVATALKRGVQFANQLLENIGIDLSKIFNTNSLQATTENLIKFIKQAADIIYRFLQGLADGFGINIDFSKTFSSFTKSTNSFKRMIDEISAYSSKLYDTAFKNIANFGDNVAKVFYTLWDKVVGHSYWPDTIEGIISNAKNLGQATNIVTKFTASVSESFKNLSDNRTDIFAILQNSAVNFLSYITTAFYPVLVQIGVILTGIMAEAFLPAKIGLITLAGLFGETIASAFSESESSKITQYFADVGAEAASRFVKSFIEGINLILEIVPSLVANGLSRLGPIGNVIGEVLQTIPGPVSVALIAAFAFSAIQLAKEIPKLLEQNLLQPLISGLGAVTKLAFNNVKIGNGLLSSLLKLPKSSLVLGAVLSLMAMLTESVTAVSAVASGIPLLYLLLLGGKDTNKFATQIATQLIPKLFKSLKAGMSQSTIDWFDTVSLVKNVKQVLLNIGGLVRKGIPKQKVTTSPLAPLVLALNDAGNQVKEIIGNIRRNWTAYTASGSTVDIFGLMFGRDTANQMANKQVFKIVFSNLNNEIKAGFRILLNSFSNTSAGKRFEESLNNFRLFFTKLKILADSGFINIIDSAKRFGDAFTKVFPTISLAASNLTTTLSTTLAPLSNSWKPLLVSIAKLAIISFVGVASAADGSTSSVGALLLSMVGLASAISIVTKTLRLFRVVSDIRELMGQGLSFNQAAKTAFMALEADIRVSINNVKKIITGMFNFVRYTNWLEIGKKIYNGFKTPLVAVIDLSKQVIKGFGAIYRSGILGNLAKGFGNLLFGIFDLTTSLPDKLRLISKSFGSIGASVARLIPLLFSVGGLIGTIVVGLASVAAIGFFGDGSFSDNIEDAVDSLARLVGILEDPVKNELARPINDILNKDNPAKDKINFAGVLNKVDFQAATPQQTKELLDVTQLTAKAFKEYSAIIKDGSDANAQQIAKVTEAVRMQEKAIRAMPQLANIAPNDLIKELRTSLDKDQTIFATLKNVYNTSLLKDYLSAGNSIAKGVGTGISEGYSIVSDAVNGFKDAVLSPFKAVGKAASEGGRAIANAFNKGLASIGRDIRSTDLYQRAFPNPDASNFKGFLKNSQEALDKYNKQFSTSENNAFNSIVRDYQNLYQTKISGARQSSDINTKLILAENKLRDAISERIRIGSSRRDYVKADLESISNLEKLANLSNSIIEKTVIGKPFADTIGFTDYLTKVGLSLDNIFTKEQRDQVKAYQLQIEQAKAELKSGDLTIDRAVELRVQINNLEQSKKQIQETAKEIQSIDKRVEFTVKVTGIEATLEQFINLQKQLPGLAAFFVEISKQINDLKQQQIAAFNNGDFVEVDKLTAQINQMQAALNSKKLDIKVGLESNAFDKANAELKALGEAEYTPEVFVAVSGDKELKQIKNAIDLINRAKNNLNSTPEQLLTFFRTGIQLTKELARRTNDLVRAADPTGSASKLLGVAEVELAGIKNKQDRDELIRLTNRVAATKELTAAQLEGIEGQKKLAELRSDEKQIKKLRIKVGIDEQSKSDLNKSAKEEAKSWIDHFNDYAKKFTVTIDPLIYIQAPANIQKEVIDLAKQIKEAAAGAEVKRKGEQVNAFGMSEANIASAKRGIVLQQKIDAILEATKKTIGDLESSYAELYEGFTFNKLELVTPEMQKMLDDYVATAKELTRLKALPANELNANVPKQIATLERQQDDRKTNFNQIKTNTYEDLKTKAGVDSKIFDKLSLDMQLGIAKSADALKIALDKLAKSTTLDPAVLSQLQSNVQEAETNFEKIKLKARSYGELQSLSGLDSTDFDKLTFDAQQNIIANADLLAEAMKKLSESVNAPPETIAELKAVGKKAKIDLDNAILEGLGGTDLFTQTEQALKSAGISFDSSMRRATTQQLETIKNLANEIKANETIAKETSNEQIRIAAQRIVENRVEQLDRLMAEVKLPAAVAAGRTFADNARNSFTSGLKGFFSSEKSFKETVKEIALTFAKNVTDTFIDGLVRGVMGEGEGSITQILTDLGAGIFGMGETVGQMGTKSNPMWVQTVGSDVTETVFGDGNDPVANANKGIFGGLKDIWNSIFDGTNTGRDSSGNPYEMLPEFVPSEISEPIVETLNNNLRDSITSDTTLFGELGGLFTKGFDFLTQNLSSLFSGFGGGGGGFDIGSIFSDITSFFGFAKGGSVNGRIRGLGHGTSDSITARLSNGEYVVNAAATQANLGLLNAINYNRPIGFATGGLVGGVAPVVVEARNKSMGFTEDSRKQEQVFNINVTGDISRQTRQEIQLMIPQITMGVNATNREAGRR